MLWYLANGSLNEYLKSQIQIQGQYYSQQLTTLTLADYSASSGIGSFKEIKLSNPKGYQAPYALFIDSADIILLPAQASASAQNSSPFKDNSTLPTTVKQLTINELIVNNEKISPSKTNIVEIIALIKSQLAQDYPELYPEISAKLYAQKNPDLNAQTYAQEHPQAGPIVEHTKAKKKRGKVQPKLRIEAITINTLKIKTLHEGITKTTLHNNVQLSGIGGEHGIVANQFGGELLLALLNLPTHEKLLEYSE